MSRQMKETGIEWIGKIPENWNVAKMKYHSSVLSGYPFDSTKFSNVQGFPLIRIRDITSGTVETLYDGEYPEEYIVHDNDLLVGMDGDFNARWWMGGDALLNQRCCKITTDDSCDLRFIYYMIPFRLNRVNELTYSTTVKHLAVSDITGTQFPMPSKDEQCRIAKYLDARCSQIDFIIERTIASIAEYKEYKKSIVTKAVSKGVRGTRPMKDSEVEWLGSIPADWNVYRIANLYEERSESGLEELPILTVSINTGVSDHEIADEDKDRVFVRSEDRTKYKRVYPGDLAYNMMRAWQGAFGAVRVDGMVSPAYVVAKPKKNVELDSRYMEALLRTSEATEEMHRYSRGIVDFRLRLYWPEFKNIRICLPSIEEQIEIADHIDEKSAAIDVLIAKKEAFVAELENYKKSMIYEYVTGKKEVPQS